MPLVHKRIPLHKGRVELNISIFIDKIDDSIIWLFVINHAILSQREDSLSRRQKERIWGREKGEDQKEISILEAERTYPG